MCLFYSSCRTDETINPHLKTGKTKGFTIFDIHKKVQATSENFQLSGAVFDQNKIDLNNDLKYDIELTSTVDTLVNSNVPLHYSIHIEILNPDLNIPQYKNSHLSIEPTTLESTVHFNGIWPVRTYIQEKICGTGHNYNGNCPITMLENKALNNTSLNWNHLTSKIQLTSSKYTISTAAPNANYDSLITYVITSPETCMIIPENQIRYLPFKLSVNSTQKYGWLEFIITDRNKLTITKAAVQN